MSIRGALFKFVDLSKTFEIYPVCLHTFYTDLPISGTPPGSPLKVYVADTGRPHCLYHNGIQNGALPAFPLVFRTTKSHRGTGQGCMGGGSKTSSPDYFRYSCTVADLWASAL